eukprot:TRINITY_DN4203_c0_g1_i2.p1 TRINITY_DN4203_c0_g1~~TRINITY_DN4203_c0_g1_i2.p1  ORF type:complete len:390 (+),score=90.02 TRINITY_DN4203_c0_g1_i2:128-1171(+)
MMKINFADECKVCTRPFTVFRWRPGGQDARYKKTEICQTCAKMKNVCQTCLLDLEYNLPVQVRDQAVQGSIGAPGSIAGVIIPHSDVHREYFAQQADKLVAAGTLPYDNAEPTSDMAQRLARNAPYYKRNRAHICSFFVRGTCKRGATCPYLHEMPEEKEDFSHQKLRDRYFGVNDPVAAKMMKRVEGWHKLVPPEDKDITTLWIGGVDYNLDIGEDDLRDALYAFGEIKSIKLRTEKSCAFVQFTTREAAELCAQKMFHKLVVKGANLKIAWAKPQVHQESTPGTSGSDARKPGDRFASYNEQMLAYPPPPPPGMSYPAPAAGGASTPAMYYPSMSTSALGANLKK